MDHVINYALNFTWYKPTLKSNCIALFVNQHVTTIHQIWLRCEPTESIYNGFKEDLDFIIRPIHIKLEKYN